MSTQTDKIGEYMRHKRDCDPGSFTCTCGLNDALAALAELERQPSQTEDLEGNTRGFTDELIAFLNEHPTDAALKNKLVGFSTGLFVKHARSLAPSPKVSGEHKEGEPVAWIIPSVYKGINKQVTLDPDVARAIRTNGGEATPLYAHPPKPSTEALTDGVIEAGNRMRYQLTLGYTDPDGPCASAVRAWDAALSKTTGAAR